MSGLHSAIIQLQRNAQVIAAQLTGVADDAMRWRPAPDAWSMLEVIAHVTDEEREDFRPRLERVLMRPAEAWTPIAPHTWPAERAYNTRAPDRELLDFRRERAASIDWLHGLRNPDWARSSVAPWGGSMTAGDLLAAWVAHDMLHIRQLNELHYRWHTLQAQPYDVDYAGGWS